MKCKYRNCKVEITTDERKGKSFCCRNCKDMEKTYVKRSKQPKKKLGRPQHIWKKVSDLTQEDREKLINMKVAIK